jgi:hypothetical protein
MSVIDAICVIEISADTLAELGNRGNLLIEQLAMKYPVDCTLFDDCGEKLAEWALGERDDETVYSQEAIADRWRRSRGGVTLLLEDADGQVGEVALIVVGECEESQR